MTQDKKSELGVVASYFESLSDPRDTRNREQVLVDIIVIAICAILSGADGPTAIHRRAKSRAAWLGRFLALPNGVPSRDYIRRRLIVLQPQHSSNALRLVGARHDRTRCPRRQTAVGHRRQVLSGLA